MHGVLLNFNILNTKIGTIKQRSGLSMGSPLSSSMSDIFLNLMEVLHWLRYCDDILQVELYGFVLFLGKLGQEVTCQTRESSSLNFLTF